MIGKKQMLLLFFFFRCFHFSTFSFCLILLSTRRPSGTGEKAQMNMKDKKSWDQSLRSSLNLSCGYSFKMTLSNALLVGFLAWVLSLPSGRATSPTYRPVSEAGPWIQQESANMKEKIIRVSQLSRIHGISRSYGGWETRFSLFTVCFFFWVFFPDLSGLFTIFLGFARNFIWKASRITGSVFYKPLPQ